jgi:hypothetical protein
MTTRALATKLRHLESLVKRRPGRNDTEDSSPPVVLPPLEEFSALPLDEQKQLLWAWRPPLSEELPPLEESPGRPRAHLPSSS